MDISIDADVTWFDEIRAGVANGSLEESGLRMEDMIAARNYFELECLVRSLDLMETIASSEGLAKE